MKKSCHPALYSVVFLELLDQQSFQKQLYEKKVSKCIKKGKG